MSHSYPSDISREQFALVLPILESARRRTKPRRVNLYDAFCGVLYVLKSGCQWPRCNRGCQKTFPTGALATSISSNGVRNPTQE
jgi:transposase